MNVGVVLPGFSASEEDWCIPALASLIRRLGERHRVRVVSLRYPYQRKRYSVFGVEVHALGGARVQGLRKFPLLARALATLGREHRHRPFDVLHAFWADEPGWVAVQAGRWLRVPSLVTLLGGELVSRPEIGYGGGLSRINRRRAKRALEGASLVSVGSSHLARLAKPRAARTEWLPIGVDLERFHPASKAGDTSPLEGGIKLLHVASLVPVKGQDSLLRAFQKATLNIPDAVLHFVGGGPLRESLERLAGELGIRERVHFHGAVPHHRLPAYYRAADLCVMSSLHEGQEWVTQEAAACGRTTVGTRVGVVPDLEPATVAVPVGDVEALAHALRRLLPDRERLRAMGEAARLRVEQDYSLRDTLERLGLLYTELSSRGPARALAPRSVQT